MSCELRIFFFFISFWVSFSSFFHFHFCCWFFFPAKLFISVHCLNSFLHRFRAAHYNSLVIFIVILRVFVCPDTVERNRRNNALERKWQWSIDQIKEKSCEDMKIVFLFARPHLALSDFIYFRHNVTIQTMAKTTVTNLLLFLWFKWQFTLNGSGLSFIRHSACCFFYSIKSVSLNINFVHFIAIQLFVNHSTITSQQRSISLFTLFIQTTSTTIRNWRKIGNYWYIALKAFKIKWIVQLNNFL